MVSLLNYKTVDSELQQQQQQQSATAVGAVPSGDTFSPQDMSTGVVEHNGPQREDCRKDCDTSQPATVQSEQQQDRFFAHIRRYDGGQQGGGHGLSGASNQETDLASTVIVCGPASERTISADGPEQVSLVAQVSSASANIDSIDNIDSSRQTTVIVQKVVTSEVETSRMSSLPVATTATNLTLDDSSCVEEGPLCGDPSATSADDCRRPDFVVTWRNLNFVIEPKWHQRLAHNTRAALCDRKPSRGSRKKDPSTSLDLAVVSSDKSRPANDESVAQVTTSPTSTRVVLDKLDGSFKSGELTAILGPSGAGKTTLLDCLTGHRKSGLSGFIGISRLARPSCVQEPSDCCGLGVQLEVHHNKQQRQQQQHKPQVNETSLPAKRYLTTCSRKCANERVPGSASNNNLKVSIIPQNDHLIGHLTVYETLNYASKMKNCSVDHFNHKTNVKYVAQQLGLMSCLSTRINKLSGGQYKRVSIAQELLSSPDILILDEPTSGLDAMTCYQTVQVLRRLTDERKLSGEKQIAVILTIHQPNSDVFQQFNHVYVVAQGGKCIYEGPPANVEPTINRVGISLPNSFYNPATMIVEIAGGKFSQEVISKLNAIQKKQYEVGEPYDEQHSASDSAVDCKSSSASLSACEFDDDESDNDDEDENKTGDGRCNAMRKGCPPKVAAPSDSNNNDIDSADGLIKQKESGFVNGGFVLDTNDAGESRTQVRAGVAIDLCVEETPYSKESTLAGGGNQRQQQHQQHRRRRRRTKVIDTVANSNDKRRDLNALVSVELAVAEVASASACRALGGSNGSEGGGGGGGGNYEQRAKGLSEKRLKLNSLKADQKFPFWRHTYLHFHRSWLSIVRDPMLCSMQLALHIIVPVMVSLVYGTNVGKPNACPRAGPVDIMAYALEPTDTALQLQEDLRTTLENIGYIFFKLYGIIFAAMTVTVLTFPLDMHVLVKEFRNGWYGLSSYFLGRTLADIPFQLTLPLLAMSLSYYATGQPYSYFQWRFLSITAILILSSLIAQSQGLLFGAILMDKMKAAVFVAPAATTPIILFAGFLVRTQSIPRYLRPLSNLSYLRYAIEACLISRYGFNQCDCDPAIFNHTVPELPPIARSMLDYWLSSFRPPAETTTSGSTLNALASVNATSVASNSTEFNDNNDQPPDLFTKLIDSLARANSFGRNITSCEQVVPYPMMDYDLHDSQLFNCFAILLAMLLLTRALTFFIVCFKVKQKV